MLSAEQQHIDNQQTVSHLEGTQILVGRRAFHLLFRHRLSGPPIGTLHNHRQGTPTHTQSKQENESSHLHTIQLQIPV